MLFRLKKTAHPALTTAKSAFSPPTRQSELSDRCRARPGHTLRGKRNFQVIFKIVRIHTNRSNRRIVLGSVLYYTSNARREAGQFEVYHQIETLM